MNKRTARKLAMSGKVTFGHLRTLMADSARDDFEPSRVNPQFVLADLREPYAAIISEQDENATCLRYGEPNPRSVLGMTNILRDYAENGWEPS